MESRGKRLVNLALRAEEERLKRDSIEEKKNECENDGKRFKY